MIIYTYIVKHHSNISIVFNDNITINNYSDLRICLYYYNNILILEDDFIWNEKLNDEKVGNSICNFINEKNNGF